MTRRVLGAALVAALAASGCGLPLDEGVQRPGPAVERPARPGDVDVLPPPPRPDDSASDVVEAFVLAQTSPRDDHAASRAYLAEGTAWDAGSALVYATRSAAREVSPGIVTMTFEAVGRVRDDGTWAVARGPVEATFRLRRAGQTWRLTTVPAGLHLSTRDRDRSFRSRSVHFLPFDVEGPLVPEPVFQPLTADPAQALVERLLAGPSPDLAGAVRSAVPPGSEAATLRAPVTTDGGTVTVDLHPAAQDLGEQSRRDLVAQLVWTLREVDGFSVLRLRSGGRPLGVDGREEHRRDDVDERDPDGLATAPGLLVVQRRVLRALNGGVIAPVPGGPERVDDVAVSPSGDLVAVLTRSGSSTTVGVGPLGGAPAVRARLAAPGSPSWGSGSRGLWLVDSGRVLLLPPGSAGPRVVPVEGAGAVTVLAVSRDGARAALVRGGVLLVGRVEPTATGPRLAGLRAVAPELRGVADVAWRSATELVVLARELDGAAGPIPVAVSVDGASVTPVRRGGLVGRPTALAAAGDDLVVVAGGDLYRDTRQLFQLLVQGGTAAAYPG